MLIAGALSFVQAQTPTATPDSFVAQVTSSPAGVISNAFASFAGEISENGRFVVIESNGDIATEKTAGRNNADGNREIFLLDYAQRRIFQITDTKNLLKIPASPTPTPTPSASPTPTPVPTPADYTNVDVEVSNNQPVLSANGRWIVFSSNASTPGSFDGNANRTALLADGNQEIFLYFIPATITVNLASGADAPFVDLAAGTFTQVTDTPASRLPQPGSTSASPIVAFDNRDATVNDNASVVSFVSSRNLTGANSDFNPEVFVYIRSSGITTQVTNTTGTLLAPLFNENPSLSGNGSVLAFISNANISAGGSSNNADGDAEIYLASVNTSTGAAAVTRQVTNTKTDATGATVNLFHFGRRVSRDGSMLAFESLATDPKTNSSITQVYVTFVYDIGLDTFTQVGPRATTTQDIFHFPTFTDYDPITLKPASVAFASFLNFRPDGTIPEAGKESEGLNNTNGAPQVFLAAIPVASTGPFTRLTNIPSGTFIIGIRPFFSNKRDRMAFSLASRELGGGNPDGSTEVYYHLSRAGTDATATISLFTGASERPIATPSPTPPEVGGLAPGMLGIIRSATALAPSTQNANSASESLRRPPLPIELNGVSVSINSAAAGLYFVSAGQINFVVPPGLAPNTGTTTYPLVINNNGTTIRSTIQLLTAQPDIFTVTNDFGSNRASVLNVTNPLSTGTPEPFDVTTTYVNGSGDTVTEPTKLAIFLTGVHGITDKTQVTVRIGTTDLTGTAIVRITPTDTPGTDEIDVVLPATLAGAGDVPVIVTITTGSLSSRPADTAPLIRIN
jgi:uncharacterized protein (TIGR03437 family)